MSIPKFEDGYFLPPGVHCCTLAEIEERFGIDNDQRRKVWSAFKRFLERKVELRLIPEVALIDGSFCTGREFPGDVDAVVLIPPKTIISAWNTGDEHEKRAISFMMEAVQGTKGVQSILRDLFGAHILIADSECTLSIWGDFFKRIKDLDPDKDPAWVTKPREKGILKVDMRGEAGYAK